MGAENTLPSAPKENRVLIDWLSWTFKNVNDPEQAIEKSGLSALSFAKSAGGGMGYKSSMRSGNIVVFYDGNENMGCHVSMTGNGCRQYEQLNQAKNAWYQLLLRISAEGATVSRIDLAIDNVDGALDLQRLEQCIDDKQIRSKFKKGHIYREVSFSPDDELPQGKTIYAGSPTSRLKIRFYDKAAQLQLPSSVHWVRAELQCMSERAIEAVKHILHGTEVGELAVSVLNNYFQPINNDDSNRSRCTVQSWWATWIETSSKMRLTTSKAIKVIAEVVQFLKKQYSPTFAMLKKYYSTVEFYDLIRDMLENGKERLTKKHEMIIACSDLTTELPF